MMTFQKLLISSDIDDIKNTKMARRVFKKLHLKKFPDTPHYPLHEINRLRDLFNAHARNPKFKLETRERFEDTKKDLTIMAQNYDVEYDKLITDEEIVQGMEIVNQISNSLKFGGGVLLLGTGVSFLVTGIFKDLASFLVLVSVFKFILDYKFRTSFDNILTTLISKKNTFLKGGWAKENYNYFKKLN